MEESGRALIQDIVPALLQARGKNQKRFCQDNRPREQDLKPGPSK
jgi:hypothetical protein